MGKGRAHTGLCSVSPSSIEGVTPRPREAGRRKAANTDWGWWSWVGSSPGTCQQETAGPHVAKQVLKPLLHLPLCREPLRRPLRPLHQGQLPRRAPATPPWRCRWNRSAGSSSSALPAPLRTGLMRYSCTRPFPVSLRDPDALHRQELRKRPGRGICSALPGSLFQPGLPSARRPKKYEGDPQLPAPSRAQCLTHPLCVQGALCGND